MLLDTNDFDIVEAIIKLSQTFGRPVIAEGVETLEHCMVLKALGCNLCQGYGISKPMPVAEVLPWVDNWTREGVWNKIADSKISPEFLPFLLVELSHRVWLDRLVTDMNHTRTREFKPVNMKQSPFSRLDKSSEIYGPEFRDKVESVKPLYNKIHHLEVQFYERLAENEVGLAQSTLSEIKWLMEEFIHNVNAIYLETIS